MEERRYNDRAAAMTLAFVCPAEVQQGCASKIKCLMSQECQRQGAEEC